MHREASIPAPAPDSADAEPRQADPRQPDLLQPLAPAQRIDVLDVVRGFALLGILLMNIEFFTRPMQGIVFGLDPTMAGADYVAGWLVMAFVQGKFWTLFSLLFGMGFAVMLERAQAAGGRFAGIYARRLLVLLLIGLAHTLLLWPGDILVPYALAGFAMLLLFRRTPVPRLWKWGLAFYAVRLLLMWMMVGGIAMVQFDPTAAEEANRAMAQGTAMMRADYAAAEPVYASGSWSEVVAQRWRDAQMQWSWFPMMLPSILGVFLLGAWFMRSGVMRDAGAHRPLFRRLVLVGLPLGALLAVVAMPLLVGTELTVPTSRLAMGTMLMGIASLLLCLGYLAAVVLATLGPAPWLRAWLAPVGRMALSNYLLQSAFFTTLFYGYGFGLWGEVPRAWQILLAVAFFAVQVLLSRWWMQRFRYGPMEWLWRALTYLSLPPVRA